MDSPMLRAAMAYLDGWSPLGRPVAALPCCAPDPASPTGCTARWHTPDRRKAHKIGKVPLVAWKQFEVRLPTGAEWRQWDRCFGRAGYNVGTLAGSVSGVLLLDVDCHDPAADGRHTLRHRGLSAPETPGVLTPSGGLHGWYLYPADSEPGTLRNFQTRPDLPGIDARGDGGFGVLPPSVHENGGVYAWGRATRDLPLAPAPAWLLAQFGRRTAGAGGARGAAPSDDWADLWRGPWTPGQRHGAACRLIGHWREHGITESEAVAMLCAWDATACDPPKGEEEIAAHVADLYGRGGRDLPDPAPWEEARPAFGLPPARLQERLCSPERGAMAGAAAECLRRGVDPALLHAWLLDLHDEEVEAAGRMLAWATRKEGGGRRAG